MRLARMRMMAVALPAVCTCLAAGIVGHQYLRRDALAREVQGSEREYQRLIRLLPRQAVGSHTQDQAHRH